MEVRQQVVDAAELEARGDEELGAPRERAAVRDRLERRARSSCRRRAPRARLRSAATPRRLHLVPLAVDVVLLDHVGLQRPERVEPDVQRHALDVESREQLGREVQAGRRRRRRALLARVDGLVALGVGERLRDVRRQRRLPGRLAAQPHAPAPLAEMLEQLDRPVARARRAAAASAARAPPRRPVPDLLQQQHLAARLLDRDPRRHDARVVDDARASPAAAARADRGRRGAAPSPVARV